jgi:hypothetical protein
VLVQLDDAPARLIGCLPGAPHLTKDQPMRVWWETLPGGAVLPQWQPADGEADG